MKSKILVNAFLCSKNNQLRLANVRFNEKIQEVKYTSSHEINWNDISNKELKRKFIDSQSSLDSTENIINGDFMLLMPGAIDAHVHFNTPGFEDREDFEHASLAAAFGGVTTVIDMPCTSVPPVINYENLQIKLKAVSGKSFIDFAFWGGVKANDFINDSDIYLQMQQLTKNGVAGFKAYLISGMDSFKDLTLKQMTQTAKWAKKCELPVAIHAEDKSIVKERQDYLQNNGNNSWQAFCFARDERAEALAVMKMIDICRQTGCKIHIVHLSSQFGAELIRQAKQEGLPVSAETCPHYLYFTQDDFAKPEISAYLKTTPPVKTNFDRLALWEALKDGTLEFVTTDHAGCDPDKEKTDENFWNIYSGIPGVEHRVPFLFSEGFKRGRLTLERTIDLLTKNVAQYYNIKLKGKIEAGFDADFSLIDLWDSQVIKSENMHCKGKYTPFEGTTFQATVNKTFLRGNLLISNGEVLVSNKSGKFIKLQMNGAKN